MRKSLVVSKLGLKKIPALRGEVRGRGEVLEIVRNQNDFALGSPLTEIKSATSSTRCVSSEAMRVYTLQKEHSPESEHLCTAA